MIAPGNGYDAAPPKLDIHVRPRRDHWSVSRPTSYAEIFLSACRCYIAVATPEAQPKIAICIGNVRVDIDPVLREAKTCSLTQPRCGLSRDDLHHHHLSFLETGRSRPSQEILDSARRYPGQSGVSYTPDSVRRQVVCTITLAARGAGAAIGSRRPFLLRVRYTCGRVQGVAEHRRRGPRGGT